ncbi:hypothetical protein [Streptomyces sp. NPDC006446]|uniref:hypothetical protein n=1 Tax=Streptomyces sp. NPDC006446 TaxID=3154301 RepID=UPI0033A3B8A3
MERGNEPSTGAQVMISVLLLGVDLMVIAWLLYGYGITGWADGYDEGNAPEAPEVAWRGMWILAGGAVVTGGGLVALRLRVMGVVQLIVLGAGALLFHSLAAHA